MHIPAETGRHSGPPDDIDDDGYAWNYYGRDAEPDPPDATAPASPRPRRVRDRAPEAATDRD